MNYIPPRRSDGTLHARRAKQPWPHDKLFRILSIDGGGIKGVLPASILAELESRILGGGPVTRFFDMVAGTSTGGIIALGLANGMTAHEARNIYLDRGATIFPQRQGLPLLAQKIRWLSRVKQDQAVLKSELLKFLGSALLDDAQVRLVIPSFEGTHGEPYIYKTPHHPDYKRDRREKMAHVALHTAAAPSFYASVENDGYVMVDGGLWANNPVMNALVDAITCYDVPLENIRILSLGTGDTLFSTASAASAGLLKWFSLNIFAGKMPLAFEASVKAQSHNALGQAGLLIGRNNLVRIDAAEGANPIDLDDVKRACKELPEVARHAVEASGQRISEMFFGDEAEPFAKCPWN